VIDRKTAENRLLDKAAQDPEFRALLLADPRSAIEREFGVTLPRESCITVLEEKPDQHFLVLPVDPAKAELGSAQLDAVAAGTYPDYGGIVVV
jgi:hypothetical protein